MVAEPLLYHDRLLGVITINNAGTEQRYTEQDRHLLSLLAAQAAITIENARLFQENQRKLEELSVLYGLSQAVAGQLDVAQLAEAIYRQVGRVMDTQKMVIFLYDESRQEFEVVLRMVRGQPDPNPWHWSAFGPGLISSVVARRQPIRTSNYRETCQQEGVEPMPASPPFPYWLGVPMMANEQVVGVLALQSDHHVFTESDERFLINVANVAALAVRGARLFGEADRQRREAEVVAALARDISASLDLDTVLQRVAWAAKELCSSDGALIALHDLASAKMVVRYRIGEHHHEHIDIRVEAGKGWGTGARHRSAIPDHLL